MQLKIIVAFRTTTGITKVIPLVPKYWTISRIVEWRINWESLGKRFQKILAEQVNLVFLYYCFLWIELPLQDQKIFDSFLQKLNQGKAKQMRKKKKKIEIHFLPITNSCVEMQSGSTNSVTIGFLLENSPFISNEAGQITFSLQRKYHERTRTPTKSLDLKRRWGITSWEEDSLKLKLIKINLISGHRQTHKSSSTFLSPSFVRTRGMDVKIWRSSSEI